MQDNIRELRVKNNRIYLREDNILYLIICGKVDENIESEIEEACLTLANMVEGKVNTLVDLNKAGKTTPEARKKQKESSKHEKTGKVALFGQHPVARVLASFLWA